MKTALIIGSGEGVEEEYAYVARHVKDATIIGVNYGATVARPDILFGNHLEVLCDEIAPAVSDYWGYRNYKIHTTPLPGERQFLPKYPWVTAWPDAYRQMAGSGVCATIASKMMGFDRAVMVGCPGGGKYNEGRSRFRPAEAWRSNWGANGKGEAGREHTDSAFLRAVPELRGFATSTSGFSREHLGEPKF